jgi:HPt (histidine-containing phosphotransfer) domain-containing protein
VRASRERVGHFERVAAQLAVDPADRAALEALRHEAHLVHGAAGTFGFPEAGRLAQEMEETAKRWLAQAGAVAEPRAPIVTGFAAELRRAFSAPR